MESAGRADFSLWDLNESYVINPEEFKSMGRNTPFTGWEVSGRCRMTVCGGDIVWNDGVISVDK